MNPLAIITRDLYIFLGIDDYSNCKIIQKEKREDYNFSFLVSLEKVWKHCIPSATTFDVNKNILNVHCSKDKSVEDRLAELINTSSKWIFPISQAEIFKEKCIIKLQRSAFFLKLLLEININETYGQFDKNGQTTDRVNIKKSDEPFVSNLTNHRLILIHRITNNLLEYSKFSNSSLQSANHKLVLTTKSNPKIIDTTVKRITCGVVFNNLHENAGQILTEAEYLKKKSLDIQLLMVHKYGIRVKNEKTCQDLIKSLAQAHVTIDLVEKRINCNININLKLAGSENNKGAAFILYTSARIETLLKKFETQMKNGYYSNLPDVEMVDFGLLKEEVCILNIFCFIFF